MTPLNGAQLNYSETTAQMTNEHWQLISSFCERLDQYLMKRFNYKTAPSNRLPFQPNVDARRKSFDLYFRVLEGNDHVEFWGGRTFVISRIGFEKKRRGHGSSLLKMITDFAQEHGYAQIGIESASTPSIHAFAAKYGFQKIDDYDNYTAPVGRLNTQLAGS
jgi:GNAT superfamily N-acetyltransferase